MHQINPFKQPRLFYSVFFIEMWERFTYYGIQAILASYVASQLNMDISTMLIFVSTFSILMYGFIYIGGYMADSLLDIRSTMLVGLITLAMGYVLLSIATTEYFYVALGCIIAGNALFQANPAALLARGYSANDVRIDSAFTLYHASLNIGAFLVPIYAPQIVEMVGWSGIMFLLIFAISMASLKLIMIWRDIKQVSTITPIKYSRIHAYSILSFVSVGLIAISTLALRNNRIFYIALLFIVFSATFILARHYLALDKKQRSKLLVVLVMLINVTLFFTVYWKMGDPLNFFAIYHVQPVVFGFEIGSLMFYRIHTFFILVLAPILAWLYNYLSNQNRDWSIPTKFTAGLFLYALSFFILGLSVSFADEQGVISSHWLLASYFLQALTELLISALALAIIAKLISKNTLGFMMGLRFMMIGGGIFIGRYLLEPINITTTIEQEPLSSLSAYTLLFTKVGIIVLVFALIMLLFLPKLKRMMYWTSVPDKKLSVVSFGHSLGNKLSKKLSAYVYFLLVGLAIFVSISTYFSARYFYNQQTSSVITSVQNNIQQGLVNNDRRYIAEQLEFISETELFSRIIILDKNNKTIGQFPIRFIDEIKEYSLPSAFLVFVSGELSQSTSDLTYHSLFDDENHLVGYFAYQTNFNQFFLIFLWWCAVFIAFLGLVAFVFVKILRRGFYTEFNKFSIFLSQIEKLTQNIEHLGSSQQIIGAASKGSEEQEKINEIIVQLMTKIQDSQKEIKKITLVAEEQKLKAKLAEVALQVSHDIRSPLSSLEVALQEVTTLPEDTRIYIRDTVIRLKEIVNNLLAQYKDTIQHGQVEEKHFVVTLVESIVAEKKIQYKNTNIQWIQKIEENAYRAFIFFNAQKFKRTLSNLIDNGVEACDGNGVIVLEVSVAENLVEIKIIDNGKGVARDLLHKVFQEGFTFGKVSGSGLGLYQAKQAINEQQGKLDIHSIKGEGTTLTITLPRVRPPEWFVSELKLKQGMTVVVLDDDKSIHNIWRIKLKPYIRQIILLDFYNPDELQKWHADNQSSNILYLCDYEFVAIDKTGIDVIKALNIHNQSYLVTNRFEEQEVRDAVTELHLKLLPKSLSSFLPVKMMCDFSTIKEAVLIDDDPMVHKTWELSTALKGIELHHFSSYEAFKRGISRFDKSIIIFIDSNLSNNIKGENVSSELPELGYNNIYLITGSEKAKEIQHKHIVAVLDKFPPWNR